jgi:nucleotidyltransferase substrate binding protein (TIGR01987 family)
MPFDGKNRLVLFVREFAGRAKPFMNGAKIDQTFKNLGKALDRLGEALHEPVRNKLAVDGTIQRFEFAIELFWKTMKRLLAEEGVETSTPRETLKKAFEAGWLMDQLAWLQMLKDRNETSHVYDKSVAKSIYKRIKKYFPEMTQVYLLLKERSKEKRNRL